MCVAWKEEKRKIVFLIKMHSMCLRLGLHKWQDMSMCAGLAVLVPQALAYCYDYDFLIQLLFKSYKVISSLQHAAWEKENNNKEKNKMQKKYMSTLAGAACVYTRTHAYANNHITHTRPPWCWWVQNNKERKRVREGEERERQSLTNPIWNGNSLLLTKCCHVTRSSTMRNLFTLLLPLCLVPFAFCLAVRCLLLGQRLRLRLWLILHLSLLPSPLLHLYYYCAY